MYIADNANNRIRKLTVSTGILSTIAGSSTSGGYSGDGGDATSAVLNAPWRVALDSGGNVYISEIQSQCIRKVTVSTGIITTIAGNGGTGSFSGDGDLATSASLNYPLGVGIDSSGTYSSLIFVFFPSFYFILFEFKATCTSLIMVTIVSAK